MNKESYTIEQLTFGDYGHTLHHCQVISPDNNWIVYDTRNHDSEIGKTTRIERVNIYTKEIETLYETSNANEFGPGVGAVTYSPNQNEVLFIHGINHANEENPYGQSRRSGVLIKDHQPHNPIYMDARNISFPYTVGALRGGTHSHCWNYNGDLISFTYNDFVLEKANQPKERVVGLMFNEKVEVKNADNIENFSGQMYSVIISDIVNEAEYGSDQIEKAFDECWLGNTNSIVFQAWVRDVDGNKKTEIFKVDIPTNVNELKYDKNEQHFYDPFKIPKSIYQKRVTRTLEGISDFRHWLRSSPNGDSVFFLKKDDRNLNQLFRLNLHDLSINQLTFSEKSITSPFNISPDGEFAVYIKEGNLVYFNIFKGIEYNLIQNNFDLTGIPNFDKNGNAILYNQYVLNKNKESFIQIFKIQLQLEQL